MNPKMIKYSSMVRVNGYKEVYEYQGTLYAQITEWIHPNQKIIMYQHVQDGIEWLQCHVDRINSDSDRIALIVMKSKSEYAVFANNVTTLKGMLVYQLSE